MLLINSLIVLLLCLSCASAQRNLIAEETIVIWPPQAQLYLQQEVPSDVWPEGELTAIFGKTYK